MDFRDFTDDQLDETRDAVLDEQERRANLSRIPIMVQELAAKYTEGGGDREELLKAVGDSE